MQLASSLERRLMGLKMQVVEQDEASEEDFPSECSCTLGMRGNDVGASPCG